MYCSIIHMVPIYTWICMSYIYLFMSYVIHIYSHNTIMHYPFAHTHTYIHPYTPYIHTHIYTHTYKHKHTHTHTHTPIYKHTHTYIYTQTHTHTYQHTHTQSHYSYLDIATDMIITGVLPQRFKTLHKFYIGIRVCIGRV